MGLYLRRELEKAEQALLKAHQIDPNNPQYLLGIVLYYKEVKQPAKAMPLARKLLKLRPKDPTNARIVQELQQELNNVGTPPKPAEKKPE